MSGWPDEVSEDESYGYGCEFPEEKIIWTCVICGTTEDANFCKDWSFVPGKGTQCPNCKQEDKDDDVRI